MTTLMLKREYQTGHESRQNREEALARLVTLLETSATGYAHLHAESAPDNGLDLGHLARLRAAHASYALATNGNMIRVSQGAWLNERHA